MQLAFIGPDMTGKSNIAEALSEKLNIPVFKNSGEWKTKLESPDYFLNLLRYGGPFLMDFMRQTKAPAILDRFYPCELVYAQAFNRDTDDAVISWMDNSFAEIGGKFVLCVRNDYSGLIDDQYPDSLPTPVLQRLDKLYREFASRTKCDVLLLETDDRDLNKQLNEIIVFLSEGT